MLENGMEALLISDAKTDKASASMEVRVGHLSDPEDLQGLAHFCEHLMFMGTEKVGVFFSPCARHAQPFWSGADFWACFIVPFRERIFRVSHSKRRIVQRFHGNG